MYFEPTKKTYYRFPSSSSTQDFEARYYYPNQPKAINDEASSQSGLDKMNWSTIELKR